MMQSAQRKAHKALIILIILYVIIASYYATSTPLYEASDELWHYPMVQYLADNGLKLPPQDPQNHGAWRQQGSQPPLYHIIAAILTAGIDTSDLDDVRRLNVHANIGTVVPDGNANMIMHNWEREQFPSWSGAALATYLSRFLSVILSALTIIVTYLTVQVIFPKEQALALGAAGLNAFIPMFLFIGSSVNNDNLSNLLGNLLILVLLLILRDWKRVNWRYYVIIGVITGAGILSKLSLGFLIPIVVLTLFYVSVRQKNWHPFIIGGLMSGGITIIIAGWWYWHNYQLYGDPTGLNRFLDIVGRREVPADFARIWSERDSFLQAFWGFFGGVNVPMSPEIYIVLNIFGAVGLVSALVFIIQQLIRRKWTAIQWILAGLTILWIGVVFLSYLQWTATTPASQGRLMFVALSSIVMWMLWGYLWWLPNKIRPIVASGIVGAFMVLALYVPSGVIRPAYTPPVALTQSLSTPLATFKEPQTSATIELYDPKIQTTQVLPGDYVMLDFALSMTQKTEQNWSLFVHLLSPDDVIIGQRDVYPGGGRLLTSEIPVPFAWRNKVAVAISPRAYAPMTVTVALGWYNINTGQRLILGDGTEMVRLGQVEIIPTPNDAGVPNYISARYGNKIELMGYEISQISATAGDTITLTLYWQALQPIAEDWIVFANIIEPQTLTKYAASNAMPAKWSRPTSTWAVGEMIVDAHELNIYVDATPGIYEIEVGLFIQKEDGSFERLPVGGTDATFIYLTRFRILPNPSPSVD